MFNLRAYRIACRVRGNKYLEKYGGQITIRSYRPSGVKTEFEKVKEGWGDVCFYGIANAAGTQLVQWVVGDLNAFRTYIKGLDKLPKEKRNSGGTRFLPFNFRDIPGFIIASSMDDEEKQLILGTQPQNSYYQ